MLSLEVRNSHIKSKKKHNLGFKYELKCAQQKKTVESFYPKKDNMRWLEETSDALQTPHHLPRPQQQDDLRRPSRKTFSFSLSLESVTSLSLPNDCSLFLHHPQPSPRFPAAAPKMEHLSRRITGTERWQNI